MEGDFVSYHANGEIEEKGAFKEGEADGFWVSYNASGQIKSKETYKDGEKVE